MEQQPVKISVFCCAYLGSRLDHLEGWLSGPKTSVRRISSLYELLYSCTVSSPDLVVISYEMDELPIDKVIHEILELSSFARVAMLVPSIKLQQFHFLSASSTKVSVIVEDPQGQFVDRILDLMRMQTERKPAIQPINRKLLGELIEDLPDALVILDESLRILYANQKLLELVDCSHEDCLGKNFVAQLGETTQAQTRKLLEGILAKTQNNSDFLELLLINSNHEVIPCRASYSISKSHKKTFIQLCIKDETDSLVTRADKEYQDQFEKFVMQLSTEILGTRVSELPRVMANGLKDLSALLSFNRLQVIALGSHYSGFQKFLCWPQNRQNNTEHELNWLIGQVFQQGSVSIFNTHSLPLDAMEEFDWLRGLKMHAMAAIPVDHKEKETGILLAFKKRDYQWNEEDFARLEKISSLVKSLLSRLKEFKSFKKTEKELVSVTKRLSHLAKRDGLTGLANRRMFDQTLSSEIRRSARQKSCLSLIITDIDYFKRYNDALGHVAGDKCLRGIGTCVDAVFQRAGDLTARYGGEEFVVILPGCNREDAVVEAERLKNAIEELNVTHPDSDISSHVTMSMGISTIENSLIDMNEFIQQADKALYIAKEKGRNNIFHFEQLQNQDKQIPAKPI